jgi:hypothetical protein
MGYVLGGLVSVWLLAAIDRAPLWDDDFEDPADRRDGHG